MRIFYAIVDTPNANFASQIWRNSFHLTLKEMGHELVEFDYDLTETMRKLDPSDPSQAAYIATNRPRLSEALVRQLRRLHEQKPVALMFSYFYDACIMPEAIEAIKAMGIVTVNWYCNASHQFHLIEKTSPQYDYILTPERHRIPDYLRIGARPIYCQMAANPSIYRAYDLPREYDLTFVGQAYGDRPEYIRQLLQAGLGVRVWGENWNYFSPNPISPEKWNAQRVWRGLRRRAAKYKDIFMASPLLQRDADPISPTVVSAPHVALPGGIIGGVLSDEEMIKLYSRSKINLGFSSCGETHRTNQRIQQVRLRDFEVPMSGGFYLAEYFDELENFFEIGKEIVCFRNADELIEKATYYLSHDEERERIRIAGLERSRRDHTWQKRLEVAFKEMGLASR
ncbi:MAG: glycosyltransferase [Verrucomicrobiota bacterium]